MNYAKLNPFIYDLPQSAQLADGTWVSNYHLLPEETLRQEGWLPVVDEQPTYNPETHYLQFIDAVEQNGSIVMNYEVIEFPPDEIDLLLEELEAEL